MKMPNPEKETSFSWRWILLGVAIALTAAWLFLTPEGLLGKADAVGYAVCHRISERSFLIGGRPMPLCARCSGMFLGALLGLAFQALQGRKGKMPPTLVLVLFGFLAFAWAFDGVNSFLMLIPRYPSFYQTSNWTRLVTGTGMGLAVSAIVMPSFIQTMYKRWEDESGVGNWKQVLVLGILAAGMDALVLLEVPWIQYPLALLSAAGVLVLLIMIYSMALVMIFNRENQYEHFSQLFYPVVGGFIVALLQIGLIDLLRFIFTSTWDGFVL